MHSLFMENAAPVKDLVNAINECLGKTVWKNWRWRHEEIRAHGRACYSLAIIGDWGIDLSVIPPTGQLQIIKDRIDRRQLLNDYMDFLIKEGHISKDLKGVLPNPVDIFLNE